MFRLRSIKGSSFPTRRSCWVTCWWVCREDIGKALRSPLPRVQGSLLKYELNYLPAPRNISLPYFCHRTPNGPMRLQLHLEAPLIDPFPQVSHDQATEGSIKMSRLWVFSLHSQFQEVLPDFGKKKGKGSWGKEQWKVTKWKLIGQLTLELRIQSVLL